MRNKTMVVEILARRVFCSALLAGATVACASARPSPEIEATFWSHRFAVRRDLAYGDDPAQKLDVYSQGAYVGEPTWFVQAEDKRPALLYIHGGGWMNGDKAGNEPWFLPFIERGWHVVNINYRLGSRTAPAAVDDAVCALRWVVDNAETYGIDRDRIVVSGGSAGGHLALMTAIVSSNDKHHCSVSGVFRTAAVINWSGITEVASLEEYLARELPQGNYARAWVGRERLVDLAAELSPVRLVNSAMPPVLTIHGDKDTIVPHAQAVMFHRRLGELRVINELLTLKGGNHGGYSDTHYQQAFGAIFAFLDRIGVTNDSAAAKAVGS